MKYYQHEPLLTPSSWTGEARRFAIRLGQLADDLYLRLGALRTQVEAICDPYPVGSVYLAAHEVSPGALFGGTWEALENEGGLFRWKRIA